MKTLISLFSALLLLSSCTTMNKRECLAGEWQEAGNADASNGLTSTRFTAHVKACDKHGITADQALYTQGYDDGLMHYCREEIGVRNGRNANDYRGICPSDLEPSFLRGYLHGLKLALYSLDHRYSEIRSDLRRARFRRLRAETDADTRRIDREISMLIQSIRDLRQDRSNVRSTIAAWTGQ